jgi:hypothetical protein
MGIVQQLVVRPVRFHFEENDGKFCSAKVDVRMNSSFRVRLPTKSAAARRRESGKPKRDAPSEIISSG